MSDRRCISKDMYDNDPNKPLRITWCERKLDTFEWYFVDANHAALNAEHKGFILPCKKCVAAIVKAFKEQGKV